MVEEALLEGHLCITKELLNLQPTEKKYFIGSEKGGNNLIRELVEDFIFPASKIVIQCRKSRGELPSDQAIPVCSTSPTLVAAFDLLVALCTGCVQNLQCLAEMLTEMYYSGRGTFHSKQCCRIKKSTFANVFKPSHTGHEAPIPEWEYMPPVGPRPPKGFVGLKNAGATCYMNSVLQQVLLVIFPWRLFSISACFSALYAGSYPYVHPEC
jgi:ubiquitin carboxyl-terminal hydrolase 9/24